MAGIFIRSVGFNDHDLMPERFSRDGGNVSPPLEWSNVPPATTELVLLVEDGDAGRDPVLHWLVTGIDPSCAGVAEGATPAGGREWTNTFGTTGWAGPQPPPHEDPHRYYFRLYAIDKPLELPVAPQAEQVRGAVRGIELASANMVGMFGR